MAMRNPGSGAPRWSFAVLPTAPPTVSESDLYHGQETIAKLAACFITHLFACPDYPPASSQSQAKLPYFIAYALHRTRLHPSVTFHALLLLQRLKARFPSACGSSGHRLFISAYMISSKVMCDDTYSNKSWCIAAQAMFTLREINQMEREMCNYLNWELMVDHQTLFNFETAVKKEIREDRRRHPYMRHSTHPPSPNIMRRRRSDKRVDPTNGLNGSEYVHPQTELQREEGDMEVGRGYDTFSGEVKPQPETLSRFDIASLGIYLFSLFFTREKDRPPLHNIHLAVSNIMRSERQGDLSPRMTAPYKEPRVRTPGDVLESGVTPNTGPGIFANSQNTVISGGTFSVVHQAIESDPSIRKSVKHIVYLLTIQTAMLF
ncbi:hypothetical protein BDN70DRAFT_873030 [Pholiota conissans]|uniref:Cyclin N-terminal domain-containing protein n=1 Tax=Pholiota conissans TaxID=109636 RepID=A0A9P6D5Z2_9AGAR|nr:hypothetical protein BDN70DRAFT_873030 [Pholiota conissans]